MKTDSKTVLIIVCAAIFTLAVVLHATLSVVGAIPESACIEEGNIILKTKIGKPVIIPEAEVTYMEGSELEPSHLIRTNGLSMGNYHTGHFKDTKTGQKYYLFLCGSGDRRFFTYQNVIYKVDFDTDIL